MGVCSSRYVGPARLDGKTAIITGCNTGIGKFTALDLYKRGCRVIMACRDTNKAQLAKEDIMKKCSVSADFGELVVRPLDLSSLESVRNFADNVMKEQDNISILINNAGVMACPKSKTADGFELQFGTNHLGHFLLTLLLLPRILVSTPARILNLSSMAHLYADPIDWDNLNAQKSYSPVKNYCLSKLANVLFTKELARRLEGKGVNVYAVHPGVVNTDLSRHADETFFRGSKWLYQKLGGLFQKDEEQGAATTLFCAVDLETASETGLYYADCKKSSVNPIANDLNTSCKLWDVSVQMVQLDGYDPFVAKPLQR